MTIKPREPREQLTRDELLVLLIEEAAEVIHAATKCLRFGWDRTYPGYGHNGDMLARELGELVAVIDELPTDMRELSEARVHKIRRAEEAKAERRGL